MFLIDKMNILSNEVNLIEDLKKKIEESKFCHAKEGGEGLVHKSKCTCTRENPCQAKIDRKRFHEAFEDLESADIKSISEIVKIRNEIVERIKTEFEDSQWWKDNVIEW